MSRSLPFIIALSLTGLFSACKIQAEKETIPEAEGNGKTAVNIRVEPMNREEIKDATGRVIDRTAEAADEVKDAATGLAAETGDMARDAGAAIDRNLPDSTPATTPSAPVIATPAQDVTE